MNVSGFGMNKIVIIFFFCFVFIFSGCGKSEKEKCEDKGSGWSWVESDKKCKKNSGAVEKETLETCRLKSSGYIWDSNNLECKEIDYLMLIRPDNYSGAVIYAGLDTGGDGYLDKDPRVDLKSNGDCVRVHKSHLPQLKVLVEDTLEGTYICSGSEVNQVQKCSLGVYEVASDDNKLNRIVSFKERTDCVILKPISN